MKRTSLCILLPLFGILLVSCSEDPGGPSAVVAPTVPEPLRSINLDDLEYETFSGTLQPGEGGIMFAMLKTWPSNCLFSLVVPESSMPEGGPIDFTMSIPTQQCYKDHPGELYQRLIIRLAPDGQQFPGPITVQGTWMPWQGAPPDTVYYYDGTECGVATVTYKPRTDRYLVTFQVYHFSDWEVGPEPPD